MVSIQNTLRLARGLLLAASLPLAVQGYSAGPPIARTGAAVDGGQNCTACHFTFRPANSGRGRVSISAVTYTPGVPQPITITVEDPDARRWGFQLTARYRSEETIAAGTFHPTGTIRVRCAPDERDAPCLGNREYVEHTPASTQAGTPDRATFTVDWTPPEKDFGEVIFYAAANAANGDGTNLGDRIYTTSKVVRTACNVTGTPSISTVLDPASLRPAIAPGGMFSIYGDGFLNTGNLYSAHASDLAADKLPTDFGCVQVSIGGQPAPILSVSGGRINAQLPLLDATGPVPVSVTVRAGSQTATSGEARALVAALAPALFTTDGRRVVALDVSNRNAAVSVEAPAKPGDTVSLFGTGFGLTDPVWQPGEFPKSRSPLLNPATITVGETVLAAGDVLYAGAAVDQPGVFQIDFRLPATLADGDVPVAVRVAGVATQAGTVIPVKN